MSSGAKIKVLVAKPGLDGHDRGAKVVARALRDAGMEVVYTGIRQTPEMIAESALQEDVDLVGLSILSGAHMELFPRVVDEMKKRGLDDVVLLAGGIIPQEDIPQLQEIGFRAIFGPGASTNDIVIYNNTVSKAHAYFYLPSSENLEISQGPDKVCYLVDCGSKNGTSLNGRALEPFERHKVVDGDEILFGQQARMVYFSTRAFVNFVNQLRATRSA